VRRSIDNVVKTKIIPVIEANAEVDRQRRENEDYTRDRSERANQQNFDSLPDPSRCAAGYGSE
jgi:hypothetical protein